MPSFSLRTLIVVMLFGGRFRRGATADGSRVFQDPDDGVREQSRRGATIEALVTSSNWLVRPMAAPHSSLRDDDDRRPRFRGLKPAATLGCRSATASFPTNTARAREAIPRLTSASAKAH
jgi:hypothetical protein